MLDAARPPGSVEVVAVAVWVGGRFPLLVRDPAGLARGEPLGRGGPAGLLVEAVVGATGTGRELAAGVHRWLPVELVRPDAYQCTRLRAHPRELVLDADAREPIREIADRLVVVEVGLLYPPLGP